MDIFAELDALKKRVAELERITMRITPIGPAPRVPLSLPPNICFFCREDHRGLPCPKMQPFFATPIDKSEGYR
jgi:hypothetical protein